MPIDEDMTDEEALEELKLLEERMKIAHTEEEHLECDNEMLEWLRCFAHSPLEPFADSVVKGISYSEAQKIHDKLLDFSKDESKSVEERELLVEYVAKWAHALTLYQ